MRMRSDEGRCVPMCSNLCRSTRGTRSALGSSGKNRRVRVSHGASEGPTSSGDCAAKAAERGGPSCSLPARVAGETRQTAPVGARLRRLRLRPDGRYTGGRSVAVVAPRSSSGPGHRPLKAETTGSNPVRGTFRSGRGLPRPDFLSISRLQRSDGCGAQIGQACPSDAASTVGLMPWTTVAGPSSSFVT